MADQQPPKVESPCIGHCCLDDDDICVGCFRSLADITGWSTATDAEKVKVLEQCEIRKQARDKQ